MCLTHPVNFPCGRKPEYPEKTHDFRPSVDFFTLFTWGLGSSHIEKFSLRFEPATLEVKGKCANHFATEAPVSLLIKIWCFSLLIKIWWSRLSNALDMSRSTTAVSFLSFIAFKMMSVDFINVVSVECQRLFPLCHAVSLLVNYVMTGRALN
jgi:hypothetical protein